MGKNKAQSAVEYIITYSWAILIIGIAVGLLYFYGFISLGLRPTGCIINGSFFCEDSMVGMYTHNGEYLVGMLLTNTNQYPISNPTINVSYDGYSSGGSICDNAVIPAGGTFLCVVKIPSNKLSIGQYVKPTIYLQAGNCALSSSYIVNGSCSNAPIEAFKGSAYGFIRYLPSDNMSISLSPSSANFAANGTSYSMKAAVSLFGYPLKGANVNFHSSNPIIYVSKVDVATASSGAAYDYISSNYSTSTNITASYAGLNATAAIHFKTPLLYSFDDMVASDISYISPNAIENASITINNKTYSLGNLSKNGLVLLNGTINNYTIQGSITANGIEYVFKNITSCSIPYTYTNGSMLTCTQPSIYIYYEPVYNQSGSVYVADEGSSQVSIINTTSGKVGNVSVGFFPTSVVAGLKNVYATDSLSNELSAINESTGNVKNISVGISIPTSTSLYKGNAFVTSILTDTIYKVNLTSGSTLAFAATGLLPLSLVAGRNGYVYVANAGSDNVSVYNASGLAFIKNISTGLFPEGLAISNDGSRLYIADNLSSEITVINTTTNSVQKVLPSGSFTTSVAVSPNGAFLYATSLGTNQLWVINATTGNVVKKIPTGIAPYSVALSSNGAFAYVANLLSDNVTAISTINYTVVGSYNVGVLPVSLAYVR
ncbi:MAG: YncE family protein [Candidatus Micrarchaeia archaeon]